MILIDSCVLLDISSKDTLWFDWSSETLERCANNSILCINPIIYAEASIRFASSDEFDEAWPPEYIIREPLPYSAAFLAAKAHIAYRRRGGTRTSTLPDFFIGAHAAVTRSKVITRDPRKFRRYFSTVELICP